MRILISNDDGVDAKGIKVLETIARTLSDDVWVVAPHKNQSGTSHSLTIHRPLRIYQLCEKRFSVTGTPTDCMLAALHHILKGNPPDLVLSGINHGANLAEDITYSGTVAAAMEASLLGVLSIALSLEINYAPLAKEQNDGQWESAEFHAPNVIKLLLKQKLQEHILVNVNFPNCARSFVKGVKVTSQGHRHISDNLVERIDPHGNPYYWVGGGKKNVNQMHSENIDYRAVSNGYISVTPLSSNLSHEPTIDQLKRVF
ncbi:MAG: 5'/3'-nucleotidase SurE [Alphaproteobacteria bacterium]